MTYPYPRSIPFLFALAALATVGATRGTAQEGPMEDGQTYPMPTEDLFPDEVLSEEFEYRKSTPYGDDSLAIALPCRTNWRWVEVSGDPTTSQQQMLPLARVVAPNRSDVAIEMKVMTLAREVGLGDWVDIFLAHQQIFPIRGAIGEYHDRTVLDAVVEYHDERNRLHVARVGFFKDGNRVFMISGSAPRDDYETYAREFALAVTSGTPQTLENEPFAEPMTDSPSVGGFLFLHPRSWNLERPSRTPRGVEAIELYDGAPEAPSGLIKIRVYSRTRLPELGPEQVTYSLLSEIEAGSEKIEMEERLFEKEAGTDLFPGPGTIAAYRISLDGTPTEVRILILGNDEAFFAICLVTPPREKLPGAWLVNQRAFEIAGMRVRSADGE